MDPKVLELFPEEVTFSEATLPSATLWAVVALFKPENRWSIRDTMHKTREEACVVAHDLDRNWTHRRILKVILP